MSTAVKVLAAVRCGGAVLVARGRGVVHVHTGPLTRGGRAVPSTARPFCGTRSRRLRLVADQGTLEQLTASLGGRRFCRACTTRLPARLGWIGRPVSRDDTLAAYADLTPADLRLAAAWSRTVEETHEVGYLISVLVGGKPFRPTTPETQALFDLHNVVEHRRAEIVARSRTGEERAANLAARAAGTDDLKRNETTRRRAIAKDRAQERRLAGGYLTPRDRELLDGFRAV